MAPIPDNIKPFHRLLGALQTGTTSFTGYTYPASGLVKAFIDLQAIGGNLTFASGKTSGYQYSVATPELNENVVEGAGVLDRVFREVNKIVHEGAGSLDIASFSPNPPSEGAGVQDRVFREVNKIVHEFAGTNDDGGAPYSLIYNQYSTSIRGTTLSQDHSTARIVATGLTVDHYSTNIAGTVNTLVAATATGGSNPFNPSIAIGGNTIIGPTAPVNAKTVYISIPNTGISTVPSWDDLYQYGVTLDYGGGNFNIASSVPVGALGQNIQIFGLNAVITGGGTNGIEYSSSLKGYRASGIFGNARLNKQINLSVGGNITGAPITLSPSLLQAAPNTWLTARSIAQLMGSICGVNVHWATQDVSVKDFSLEPGVKGIDVIRSMAGRVGATLRWFGNNNYYVAYPNQTTGAFYVPNQNLIAQGGISKLPLLDLETGVGGVNQGFFVVPGFSTTSSTPQGTATVPLPSAGSNNPTVTQVAKVTKLLTDDDPPLIFDLPFDYDQVYIQILIAPGQSTSGANGLGIQNFVTTDPQQVFLFSDVGFGNQYVFNTLVGNAYIPQTKVDAALMPENDAVQAGNFVLTIFATHKGLQGAFEQQQQDAINNAASTQARNPQFIKTYQGKINCLFFGVMPLPGMYGSATVDDLTVAGVIESVTFTPPGLLAIDVAQYARINMVQPYNQIGNV